MSPRNQPAHPSRRMQAKDRSTAAKSSTFLSVLVIASIAVVIVGILLLKERQPPAETLSALQGSAPSTAPTGATAEPGPKAVAGPVKPSSPAAQLDHALSAGQPVLVFMHSTTCQSCINMMKVVDEVYPEFAGQIALVDVDVYEVANAGLLQVLGLRYIPTIVVFDQEGQPARNVGVMAAEEFRIFLRQRALGS